MLVSQEFEVKPRDIIDAINGFDETGKPKTSFGIFFENLKVSDDTHVSKNSIVIEKPEIDLFSFSDEEGNIYYKVSFLYKSVKDEDFKQQWALLQAFCLDANMVTEENIDSLEYLPVLTISLVPKKYGGEFFALGRFTVGSTFIETIEKTEKAFDDSVSISIVFGEDEFEFMSTDPDMIDARSIENEVEAELEAEFEEPDSETD